MNKCVYILDSKTFWKQFIDIHFQCFTRPALHPATQAVYILSVYVFENEIEMI